MKLVTALTYSRQPLPITIIDNGIVTGIRGTESLVGDEQWYTLDGKKLNSKPKAKVVYIVNRQKIVIK